MATLDEILSRKGMTETKVEEKPEQQPQETEKQETQPTPTEVKETGENGAEGEKDGNLKGNEEAPKVEEQKPTEEQPKKPTKLEQSRYAFAKLTSKNSKLKADQRKILEALEKYKGVKYDKETMSLDDYLSMRDEANKLQTALNNIDSQLEDVGALDEVRTFQSRVCFENEQDLQKYEKTITPEIRKAIYNKLGEVAPIVKRFLISSEDAPILELAFMDNVRGQSYLDYVNTNDGQETWFRCHNLCKELKKATANAVETKTATETKKPEEVNTQTASTRATGSVNGNGATGGEKTATALSREQVLALLKGKRI